MRKLFITLAMLLTTAVLLSAPVSQLVTRQLATAFFHGQGGIGDLQIVDLRHSNISAYTKEKMTQGL